MTLITFVASAAKFSLTSSPIWWVATSALGLALLLGGYIFREFKKEMTIKHEALEKEVKRVNESRIKKEEELRKELDQVRHDMSTFFNTLNADLNKILGEMRERLVSIEVKLDFKLKREDNA